jgi:argininosuccinate lyase
VNKGVPFRESHAIVGKVVRAAGEKNIQLEEIPLEAYQAIGGVLSASQSKDLFEADVLQVFDALKSVEKRNGIGGTSLQSVKNQIQIANQKSRRLNHVQRFCPECARNYVGKI